MSTTHNRIKVSDLENNEPNKTLVTNENGELEFSDINENSTNLVPASANESGIVDNTSMQELGGVDKTINGVRIGLGNYQGINNNTALGRLALNANLSGVQNTAVGNQGLYLLTSGMANTVLGHQAGYSNLTGSYNTNIGKSAGAKLTGTGNTTVGATSTFNSVNTSYNTALGYTALHYNVSGERNTAIGAGAGSRINSYENVALGYNAMGGSNTVNLITGGQNIVIGFQAGRDLTSGSKNILIENITNASVTTGSNNIMLNPRNTNGINTGSGNTIIGGFAGTFDSNDSELVVLGSGTGTVALRKNTNNELIAPTLTKTLIDSGGVKSLITKEYLDTALDKIGLVNNLTSTALSATTLNATYPNSKQGLRVYCPSISGGALIYEKTVSNWIQYAVTTVL